MRLQDLTSNLLEPLIGLFSFMLLANFDKFAAIFTVMLTKFKITPQ
ncbi:hypothetical protein VPMS16_1111 [Vibrio sp. 16]|nr:hypothetical protein VPMS16_1111 [Vibrio sp. 16]